MEIDYSPRCSGKTTRLIKLMEDKRYVLLTYSMQEEQRLKHQYPQVAERIYFWGRYRDTILSRSEKESNRVLVDNADYILEKVIGDWICIGTFTHESKIELRSK